MKLWEQIEFNPIQYGLFLKHYVMGGGGGGHYGQNSVIPVLCDVPE